MYDTGGDEAVDVEVAQGDGGARDSSSRADVSDVEFVRGGQAEVVWVDVGGGGGEEYGEVTNPLPARGKRGADLSRRERRGPHTLFVRSWLGFSPGVVTHAES